MFSRLFAGISKKDIALSVLGSGILAFGLYNIHSIAGVTEGGMLGFSLLLDHWFSLSPAVSNFVFNVLCYVFAWRVLGRRFLALSVIAAPAFSLWYALFELYPRVWPEIADYPLLAALLGAGFVGVGVGLCARVGGAPGGDDALAMALAHVFKCSMQRIYLFGDLSVLLLSLSYIPVRTIMYSLLTVILSGQIIGWMTWKKADTEPGS